MRYLVRLYSCARLRRRIASRDSVFEARKDCGVIVECTSYVIRADGLQFFHRCGELPIGQHAHDPPRAALIEGIRYARIVQVTISIMWAAGQ